VARALATDPKLIALDEPAAGMNATEKVTLRELIDRIRRDGRTILLIEHDVKLVMGLCDRSPCSTTASRSPKERRPRCSATRR
jgi:branched-chain amino acid transport system ATP-binding protein